MGSCRPEGAGYGLAVVAVAVAAVFPDLHRGDPEWAQRLGEVIGAPPGVVGVEGGEPDEQLLGPQFAVGAERGEHIGPDPAITTGHGGWFGVVGAAGAGSGPGLGVNAGQSDRGAVGADRLANAIAVRERYGTPAIVVDLGTATTFDCISREGAYLGGIIAPGVGTSSEELFRRAARLPRVELRAPSRAVGRTTEESLRAGVIWGHAGQIDALVRRLALEMKGTPHIIATGGFARLIAPQCETINRVDEALTLSGMRLIWQRGAK